MNTLFKKNEIVTVISVRHNVVTIQSTTIISCGAKKTVFKCFDGWYETSTITPTIEELEKKEHCYDCIVPNQDFINRYIEVAKKARLNALERVSLNLKKIPNSLRFKSHFELYKDEICVKDLRK